MNWREKLELINPIRHPDIIWPHEEFVDKIAIELKEEFEALPSFDAKCKFYFEKYWDADVYPNYEIMHIIPQTEKEKKTLFYHCFHSSVRVQFYNFIYDTLKQLGEYKGDFIELFGELNKGNSNESDSVRKIILDEHDPFDFSEDMERAWVYVLITSWTKKHLDNFILEEIRKRSSKSKPYTARQYAFVVSGLNMVGEKAVKQWTREHTPLKSDRTVYIWFTKISKSKFDDSTEEVQADIRRAIDFLREYDVPEDNEKAIKQLIKRTID